MGEPALKLTAQQEDKASSVWTTDDGHEVLSSHVEPAEEGEGNWLVSYADMMTLLVGFFVVLQSFSKIDSKSFEQVKMETTKLFGGEYKVPFEDLVKDLKKVVQNSKLTDQVVFNQTDQGIEVTFRGALFFDSGGYELKPQALELLSQLVPIISEKAKDFGIVVEGHTDSTPLASTGPISSNWELSSVRACRVLRLFLEKGMKAQQLKALGWGDTKPIMPNANEKGEPIPENQAQNRRVVIKILKHPEDL